MGASKSNGESTNCFWPFWRPWLHSNGNVSNKVTTTCLSNGEIKCSQPECSKTFKRESDHRRHNTSIHKDSTHEICSHCSKRFTRKDNLTRHLKSKHNQGIKGKPRCQFCRKELSRMDAVKRHETTCMKNSICTNREMNKVAPTLPIMTNENSKRNDDESDLDEIDIEGIS